MIKKVREYICNNIKNTKQSDFLVVNFDYIQWKQKQLNAKKL